MRIRTLAAWAGLTAVLGVVVTMLTWARPPRAVADVQPSDKAALRAQMVKLRTEVELLQLRHDATRANLLEAEKRIGHVEFVGETHKIKPLGMVKLQFEAITGGEEFSEAIDRGVGLMLKSGGEAVIGQAEDLAKQDVKELGDALRSAIDRMEKKYANLVIELNEKRLELVEVEKRYNDARPTPSN